MQNLTPHDNAELKAARIAAVSQRNTVIQVILVVSSFAGLCGSLFPILKSIYFSDYAAYLITGATTVGIVALLLAFFFIESWKVYLKRVTIILLFGVSLTLSGILYWKYFVDVDRWLVWDAQVNEKVAECEKDFIAAQLKNDKAANFDEKVACVGDLITHSGYPEGGKDELKIRALEEDTRAGSLLLRNPTIFKILETRLGVGEKFIGTGFAIPSGDNKVYGDAILPEYLVPNRLETEREILTWQKTPVLPNLNQTVGCLIAGCANDRGVVKPTPPSNIDPTDPAQVQKYKDILDYVRLSESLFDDKKIVLVRFSQFNPVNDKGEKVYKGRLGRDDASRVFMVRLRDIWDMSLQNAMIYSGRKVKDTNAETLFVWLYAASDDEHVTRATWRNIIDHLDELLKK